MIRSLWIAKTGLDAQQTNLDVISNNLANVSTNGFKRARAVFEDLLYQTMRQPGAQSSQQTQMPSGLMLGTGVRPIATERILPRAACSDRKPARHRRQWQWLLPDPDAGRHPGLHPRRLLPARQHRPGGDLQRLSAVADHHHPEQCPEAISISRDGIVSYTQQGSGDADPGRHRSSWPASSTGGLQSMGENLFIETAASGTPTPNTPGTNGTGLLNQGYVETSNVNVAEELVTMIQTQRAYELNSKAVSTSDAMLARLTQL
jgi:flagellar basal-body rod protein FlgG